MLNKKGISPLIATVLIIGFTIVIAALVITFGTNLVRTTTENTQTSSDVSLACQQTAIKTKLTTELVDGPNKILKVAVDNGASIKLEGFVFRVYNVGETSADVLDTKTDAAKIISSNPGVYSIESNGLTTFEVDYDETKITTPVKLGVKPRIIVSGQERECDEITKTL